MMEARRNTRNSRIAGCLLGGAIGDALGAPVEFLSLPTIRAQYGPQGVKDYIGYNRLGAAEFTDDTQMTLFTAEGLLRALAEPKTPALTDYTRHLHQAYLNWHRTQQGPFLASPASASTSALVLRPDLWKRQAPGMTCLNALGSGRMGTPDAPLNDSKGCGGVMRAAPAGFVAQGKAAFELGCAAAAITHGHPSGYLSAGYLAQMIAELLAGQRLEEAIKTTSAVLALYPRHEETLHAVQQAAALAEQVLAEDEPTALQPETVEKLGRGWVAEEALAIGLYCALVGAQSKHFARGVLLAVNISGDSDSTGSITGNLLGALLGREALPDAWVEKIEMRSVLEELAGKFA